MGKITLYHFTSEMHYQSIQSLGYLANNGDVPITGTGGFKALWLTSNPDPNAQKWEHSTGKNGLRFEIEFEDDDPGLAKWSDLTRVFHMTQNWQSSLRTAGGDPDDWYVYVEHVKLGSHIKVEYMDKLLKEKEVTDE